MKTETPRTSTGPRTKLGKARSSKNAAFHGLSGHALVLPGETVDAYFESLEIWFQALRPRAAAERQIVARIADVQWRRDRCDRIEHERLRAQIGREMEKTDAWRSASALKNTLVAVRDLVRTAQHEADKGDHSRPLSHVYGFLAPARRVLEFARQTGAVEDDVLLGLGGKLDELEAQANGDGARQKHLLEVIAASELVTARVESALKASLDRVEEITTRISEMLVPEEKTSKTMARYRAELERSQARLLDLLEQVRGASRTGRSRKGSSFRKGNSSPVFRLRVVR